MEKMQKIYRVCQVLRWLTIAVGLVFFAYIVLGSFVVEGWDMDISGGTFAQLWQEGVVHKLWLIAVAAPEVTMTLLFYYWLQALFGRYQQGQFFSEASMRCYLWLVWLSFSIFIYELITPFLLLALPHNHEDLGVELTINLGEFFTLSLLVVILHLLKMAQQIEAENKEFV